MELPHTQIAIQSVVVKVKVQILSDVGKYSGQSTDIIHFLINETIQNNCNFAKLKKLGQNNLA